MTLKAFSECLSCYDTKYNWTCKINMILLISKTMVDLSVCYEKCVYTFVFHKRGHGLVFVTLVYKHINNVVNRGTL